MTAGTLFRGETPGDRIGPYLSQFQWLDIPFGQHTFDQRHNQPLADDDFMVDYNEWLAIQRGAAPTTSITFDANPRYIASNRALGECVHVDFSFQGYLSAALIMLGFGSEALSDRNPYQQTSRQGGFVTFGGPQILDRAHPLRWPAHPDRARRGLRDLSRAGGGHPISAREGWEHLSCLGAGRPAHGSPSVAAALPAAR